jgi:predicted amidophosphoribosyltransferase
MYCSQCGSQLVASANYCHVCGTKVSGGRTHATNLASPVYEVCETTFIMIKDRGVLGFTLYPFGGKLLGSG